VLATDIHVEVRTVQQERLVEKLKAIQKASRHTFPGTVARYVIKGNVAVTTLQIVFIERLLSIILRKRLTIPK
jgi:hypothetical protein